MNSKPKCRVRAARISERDHARTGDHDLLDDLDVLPFPTADLDQLVLEPAGVQARLVRNPARTSGTAMNPAVLVQPGE